MRQYPPSRPSNITIPRNNHPYEAYNGDTHSGHVSPFSSPPSPITGSHASLRWALESPPPMPASFSDRIQQHQAKRKPQQATTNRDSVAFQTTDPSGFQAALGGPEFMPFQRARTPQPYPQSSQAQRSGHARRGSQQRGERSPYPNQSKSRFPVKANTEVPGNHKSRSTTGQGTSRRPQQDYSRPTQSSTRPPARPAPAAGSRTRPPARAAVPPQPSRQAVRSGARPVRGEKDYFVGQTAKDLERQQRQKKKKSRGCFGWWYVLVFLICGSALGVGIGFAVKKSLKHEYTVG